MDALIAATREMVRVLKPSGSIWVNLGDKYASHGTTPIKRRSDDPESYAQSAGLRTRPIRDLPHKSLMGIPWRYAIRCIDELGLILRAEVIWSKPNGLPESVTDRVRRSHETWFHFTLSPRYYSAVDEVREPHERANYGRVSTGRAFEDKRNGDRAGVNAAHMDGNPLGKLPGSVWTIATEPLRVPDHLGIDHFAAFPTEWPRRIITGWSPAGVCVECGEGLRPITTKDGGRPVARAHRHLPGYADPAGEGMRDQTYRIEGYECTCHTWTPRLTASARTTASTTSTTTDLNAAAAGTRPALTPAATATVQPAASETTSTTAPNPATPSVRPAVVLDPFGGTGTTALVASALGRHGISVDMSADYCRLAEWRTTDPKQRAKAARKPYTPPVEQINGQAELFEIEVTA